MDLALQPRSLVLFDLDYELVDARNSKLAFGSMGAWYDRTYSRTTSRQAVTTVAFRYHRKCINLGAVSDRSMGLNGEPGGDVRAAEVVVVCTAE